MEKIELIEMIIELLLVPILIYGLTLLRGYIIRNTKIKQVESILLQATMAVEAAVGETTQVFVEELKEQGDFTKENAEIALERSMNTALTILGEAGENLLGRAVGDVNLYLDALIEAEVKRQNEGEE